MSSKAKRKKPHYYDEPVLYAHDGNGGHDVDPDIVYAVSMFRGCRVVVREFYTTVEDRYNPDYYLVTDKFYVATLKLKSGETISLRLDAFKDEFCGDGVEAKFTYHRVNLFFIARPSPNKLRNGTKGWIKWRSSDGRNQFIRLRLSNNLVKFVDGNES